MRGSLAGLCVILFGAAAAFAQTYTVFPQFASGGGWTSEIFLVNQGLYAASGVVVSFYGDDGAPMSIESNLGVGSSFSLNVNAGATQVIRVTPSSAQIVGSVVVRYPTTPTVRATEVFRYEENGTVLAEVGVSQQGANGSFSFPVEINPSLGISTAVAMANPTFDSASAQSQTVILSLIDAEGKLRNTAQLPLGAGQHTSLYLTQAPLFPGVDNFTGSVSISSPLGINVLALRQDKQAFGSISTSSGPLLGPFAVAAAAVGESEPNNSTAQARSISGDTLVAGTIGSIRDIDLYKITGSRNDVVSAFTSTQGLNTSIDTIMLLLKSDGSTVIAANDDNGVSNQPDSFLQAVLPEDGTYYIAVYDYYQGSYGGGPYYLHIRLLKPSE